MLRASRYFPRVIRMSDDLQPIVDRLGALIANLKPAERRRLAGEVARSLRGSQAKRIRDNKAPDGSAFEPKKPQPQLRKRRGGLRMFRKLQRAHWLKPRGTASEASLAFAGFAAHIARVNQLGLRDQVSKSGAQYEYPKRELLGFTDTEIKEIETVIINHLAK